jgi:hypothetical protein
MKQYKTNGHYFKPRHFLFPQLGRLHVIGSIRFTKESIYETTNPFNQADWNKGGGLSHSIVPNKNAVMIGWRYYKGKFQAIPYINKDGQNIHSIFQPIDLEMDKLYLWSIRFNEQTGLVEFEIGGKMYTYGGYNWSFISFPRMPYFGGDDTPKNEVSIDWWSNNT